jgi:hypothetical protein
VTATTFILKGTAIAFVILLARKAFIDVDLMNYDSLAYHLPFAARLWNITSARQFAFVDSLEDVYRGFPLLGETLQGFQWVLFGRMQAANLLALGSLVLYCYVGWIYLRIPWYSTFLALLAVPLVQIHASASLVDLPANLATAVVLLLAYHLYVARETPSWTQVLVLAIAAGISINTKFLHTGVVAIALAAALGRLIYVYRVGAGEARRRTVRMLWVLVMTMPLVFATPIKNTILHGNPFYPFAVRVLGVTLPHTWALGTMAPDYLAAAPRPVRWLLSLLEYRAFDSRRPYLWTGEQGYLPAGVPADRMGGYFFLYVLVNALLLGLLVWRLRSREARVGGVCFILLSLVVSAHPQSHELRYYMYWIVILITLNLYLLVHGEEQRAFPVTLQRFSILCCLTLFVVVALTRGVYLRPMTQTIMVEYVRGIEPTIRAALEQGPMLCVVGRTKSAFLYADTFHPPLEYSVKAARRDSQCGSRVIIPAR